MMQIKFSPKTISLLLLLALAACSNTSSVHQSQLFQREVKKSPPIWQSIQSRLALQHFKDQPSVKAHYRQYCKHAYQIEQTLEETLPTLATIAQLAVRDDLPSELILLPYIESHYNPEAYSRTGAAGLWQLMPGTASGLGLRVNWWTDQRKNMLISTEAALTYLDYLFHYFDENWLLAIAAYDSGEGTVKAAIRKNKLAHKPIDFWSLPLPKETRAYIPRLLALSEIIQHPDRCDLTLPAEDVTPLSTVSVPIQLTMNELARGAHMSTDSMTAFNPQYLRGMTEYHQPEQQLLLPFANAILLENYLNNLPHLRLQWQHHQVVAGDSLASIAKQFRSKVPAIRKANHLKHNTVKTGDHLLIPVGNLKGGVLSAPRMNKQSHFKLGPQQTIHTIKLNDTLSAIAKTYHITTGMIRFWNPSNAKQPLIPGKRLVLWLPRHKHFDFYTVQSGDTLGEIAMQAGISTRTLKRANGLSGNVIHPDQVLRVPMSKRSGSHTLSSQYSVKKGDSFYAIANRHHIAVQSLLDWNGLSLDAVLQPGQKLTIYR